MNIFELIRCDHEQFHNRLDRIDELGSARARRGSSRSSQHSGRWIDPDDFGEIHLLHPLPVDGNSRELSLEEIDDRVAVDMWLREMARS